MDRILTSYLAALATTMIWGLVVLVVRGARSPGHLGVACSMPAGILVLLLAQLTAGGPGLPAAALFSRAGIWLALGGICQFPLATIFFYEVVKSAEISVAVPLTRLKAVFVVMIAFALGMEVITGRIVLASLLAVLGAVLLTWRQRAPAAGAHHLQNAAARRGIVCALLASLSWALGDIFMRLALESIPALPATITALAWGAVIHLIALGLSGRLGAVRRLPAGDIWRFATHGALSFGGGYYLFFYAVQNIGVSRAAIITSAWPLIACAAGVALYHETISWRKGAGIALIMLSVIMVMV